MIRKQAQEMVWRVFEACKSTCAMYSKHQSTRTTSSECPKLTWGRSKIGPCWTPRRFLLKRLVVFEVQVVRPCVPSRREKRQHRKESWSAIYQLRKSPKIVDSGSFVVLSTKGVSRSGKRKKEMHQKLWHNKLTAPTEDNLCSSSSHTNTGPGNTLVRDCSLRARNEIQIASRDRRTDGG